MEPIENWRHDLQLFVSGRVPGPSSRKTLIITEREVNWARWESAVNTRPWPWKQYSWNTLMETPISHNRPAALGRTIGKHAPHHSEDKIRLISIYVETVCVFQGTQYSKR